MATEPWEIDTASEEFLVGLCEEAKAKNGNIGTGSACVVKLSEDIAVKYGHGVEQSEAETQQFAHRYVDPNIVHIPQVYRFFQVHDDTWHRPKGYLFMQYIFGQAAEDLDLDSYPDIVPRVAKIIEHFGQIQGGKIPGPMAGGQPQGYLWGDEGANASFTCVADLEKWMNKRLSLQDKSIDLVQDSLVLCHMDFCRRNMILKEDHTIALLDWGFAGLYPRFFEIASLSCMNPYDKPYEKPLLKELSKLLILTDEEKKKMALLQIARAYSLRYRFETKGETYGLPEGWDSLPPPEPLPSQGDSDSETDTKT